MVLCQPFIFEKLLCCIISEQSNNFKEYCVMPTRGSNPDYKPFTWESDCCPNGFTPTIVLFTIKAAIMIICHLHGKAIAALTALHRLHRSRFFKILLLC